MSEPFEIIYATRFSSFLQTIADNLETYVSDILNEEPRVDRVTARAKSVERFIEKAHRTNVDGSRKYSNPLTQIQDQIGVRVITFYSSDVERIAEIAKSTFRHIESIHHEPESDSEFGYFGRHFVFLMQRDFLPDSVSRNNAPEFFEFQIKTLFQHAWGEANHDLGYKPQEELTSDDRRRIAFTAAQAWGADQIFDELHKKLQH